MGDDGWELGVAGPLTPIVPPEPSVRARRMRRGVIAAVVCAALGVIALFVWVGLQVLDVLGPASPPYHPGNASWRYGVRVMENKLYNVPFTGSVADACRAALVHPSAPPRP